MDFPIVIHVKTQYLPEHEAAGEGQYVFAYQVTIHNQSAKPIQLIDRFWLITDGNGKQKEVQGEGVVGKQPTIEPGDVFSYTSGAVLDTPVGTMQGHYGMRTDDGESFKAAIDVFSLSVPSAIH
jgi:ApaG protein